MYQPAKDKYRYLIIPVSSNPNHETVESELPPMEERVFTDTTLRDILRSLCAAVDYTEWKPKVASIGYTRSYHLTNATKHQNIRVHHGEQGSYLLVRERRSVDNTFIGKRVLSIISQQYVPIYGFITTPEHAEGNFTEPGWYALPHNVLIEPDAKKFTRRTPMGIPATWIEDPASQFEFPAIPIPDTQTHIPVVINHYGRERKKHPKGGMVGTYKLGPREALFTRMILDPSEFEDISSKQTRTYSYYVIQDRDNILTKPHELIVNMPKQAIEIVLNFFFAGSDVNAWMWFNDEWYEFPSMVHGNEWFASASQKTRYSHRQPPTYAGNTLFGNIGSTITEGTPEPQIADAKNPAGYPVKITGNGMVMTWKVTYAEKPPCWWIEDEVKGSKGHSQTYKHKDAIDVDGARWSRNQRAWFYTRSSEPPAAWLRLVGYNKSFSAPVTAPAVPKPASTLLPREITEQYPKISFYWNNGNPTVWAALKTRDKSRVLFVAKYDEADDTLLCYAIEGEKGEKVAWGSYKLPSLEMEGKFIRDTEFTPQPFSEAVAAWRKERGYAKPTIIEKPLSLTGDSYQWRNIITEDQKSPDRMRLMFNQPRAIYAFMNADNSVTFVEVLDIVRPAKTVFDFNNGTVVYRSWKLNREENDPEQPQEMELSRFAVQVAAGAQAKGATAQMYQEKRQIVVFQKAYFDLYIQRTRYLALPDVTTPDIENPWG